MLEVGWSELLVIAIILIVVVGPKDLPAMMRTFGRMMGRVRTMANEFRSQFDEAMREAELDDVRKGLGEVNKYNPAGTIRDAINPIRQLGQDIRSELQKASTIPSATSADEGTRVSELSSDPALEPEPAPAEPEPVAPEPAVQAAAVAAAPATAPAVVATPAAQAAPAATPAAEEKPAARTRAKKQAVVTAGDYPPPARKSVRRKAAEPGARHDVRVVAGEGAQAVESRSDGTSPVGDAVEPAPKARAAARKKTTARTDEA